MPARAVKDFLDGLRVLVPLGVLCLCGDLDLIGLMAHALRLKRRIRRRHDARAEMEEKKKTFVVGVSAHSRDNKIDNKIDNKLRNNLLSRDNNCCLETAICCLETTKQTTN